LRTIRFFKNWRRLLSKIKRKGNWKTYLLFN